MILTGYAVAKSGLTLLARIVGGNAYLPITQATLTSIAYSVYDRTAETTEGTGSLTVGNVVFDALQTGPIWTKDEVGYNFRWTVPATLMVPDYSEDPDMPWWSTPKKHRFQIDIRFTPVSGEPFIQSWQFDLQEVFI